MKHAILPAAVLLAAVQAIAQDNPARVFDRLLSDAVRDQRVDYALIEKKHLAALNTFLDLAERVDPKQLNDKERLAHYTNLYNASMIKAVLDRGGVAFKPSDNNFQVFKDRIVRTKDGLISLDELEHGIIRKQFRDARIHAALVCGAVSCPPLINKAYTADTLDGQLDKNVTAWLADTSRNVIDDANKTLKLSQIFEWFAEDFGGKDQVARWVSDRLGRDVSTYRVEFVPYDWSLNKP
jgi:hypothetical protein